MIPLHDLHPGNRLITEYEGQIRDGVVLEVDHIDHVAGVRTNEQELWYTADHLFPITLNDDLLQSIGFEKVLQTDSSVKYKKGPFRIQAPSINDFSTINMWYREDYRTHPDVHYLHQLQNQYYQMTKVELIMEG